MHQLAQEFWQKNNGARSDLCRIQWVVKESEDYFYHGGCEKALEKESKLSQRYFENPINNLNAIFEGEKLTLKLLDVGSCYSPFSTFSNFNVTAIDLVPATEHVLKCDFLKVIISKEIKNIQSPCTTLPEGFFDIVVFSLLLEYFPSAQQRFTCCKNAYELLKPGGLLFILTPDSKHATANSKVMKSWRLALAALGFLRVSYQKLKHLHCMAYRKCADAQVAKHWFHLQQCPGKVEELLYIPQDFQENREVSGSEESEEERTDADNNLLADNFSNMPDFGNLTE